MDHIRTCMTGSSKKIPLIINTNFRYNSKVYFFIKILFFMGTDGPEKNL